MTHLVSKIEALLLDEPLNSLCGMSAVYLTIENNILSSLEYIREIADHAPLVFDDDFMVNVLVLISSGYISIKGLKAFKALNIERELSPDYSYEKIVANINMLKYKLEHPGSEINTNLYGSLRQSLKHINPSELTWQNPEANIILNDDLGLIKNLGRRQKKFDDVFDVKISCG
ncbi:7558_t:CDS:2 [Acaulospora morrowiae]|uniref:7558_t:CDS:1 n=1 Tax=Acaulospora morrowiae TaxID=94023 RepID=A0A9N9BJU0_9GLOM|nr:7558_t:CDS:2 [Acaulospora morrowiae]